MAQDANAHLNGTGSDGDGDSEVAESGPDDDNELDDEEDEELDDDYMQQLAKEARRLKVAVHMAVSCILVCWLLSFVHNLLTRHALTKIQACKFVKIKCIGYASNQSCNSAVGLGSALPGTIMLGFVESNLRASSKTSV